MKELFDKIEGLISLQLGIASGYKQLMHMIRSLDESQALLKLEMNDLRNRAAILLDKEINTAYQHPDDTAITIYLWALNQKDRHAASQLVENRIEGKNLFWAKKIGEEIIRNAKNFR